MRFGSLGVKKEDSRAKRRLAVLAIVKRQTECNEVWQSWRLLKDKPSVTRFGNLGFKKDDSRAKQRLAVLV
jgi:hypothetical protein